MDQLEAYILGKEAGEVVSTESMPLNPPPSKKMDNSLTKTIPKTGGALSPYVDVSGEDAPRQVMRKQAEYYALPSLGRYPLDDYAQVKTASAYFEGWGKQMTPAHRREFCSNLVKRASMLGIKVSDTVNKYGSDTYASTAELGIALDGRRSLLKEASHRATLQELLSLQPVVMPEEFALVLHEFDKMAGIDQYYDSDILDPYFSTYGVKTAEANISKSPEGSITVGNEYMSRTTLKNFAATRFRTLESVYGADMAKEFQKDPEGIFNSLPLDQKLMVMRMVTDNAPKERTSA